jgi:uncharacterized protein involved in exopolysaccharide biosynthesis
MVLMRQRKKLKHSLQIDPAPLDVGFGGVLHVALASLWRRKLLVGAIVAMALALGTIAVFAIPPSYTAEAYIRGGFVASNVIARDEDKKDGYGLDLIRVIETQSRMLESYDLAGRVVKQLGLEQLEPELRQSHWLPNNFYASAANISQENRTQDQTQQAITTVLNRLSVSSDPLRTYLITVRYTGTDPALAVTITNAFVAEFVRSSKLQALNQQRASMQTALSEQLVRYGGKHPNAMRAKMRLLAADNLLSEELNRGPEALLESAGQTITKAIAATPSPNPRLVIGLSLLLGLLVGIAIALWLERSRWAKSFSHYLLEGHDSIGESVLMR